jgi:hypothetical protein
MVRPRLTAAALAGALALTGCGGEEAQNQPRQEQLAPEPVRPSATDLPPGTTPVAERVAVIGVLNKRNGIARDLTLRPGEAVRIDDVIVRLQTCETTAPWEAEQLTGAFVQVDARNLQNQFQRVFSGWLFKESPSLNVVEHPIYDVWVKSCAMTHPSASGSPDAPAEANSASNATKSGGERPAPAPRSGNDKAPSNTASNISR